MSYRKMKEDERLARLDSIRSDLDGWGNILFAYIFGSFKEYDEAVGFRDIDVAVYLSDDVEDTLALALSIGAELAGKYNIPIDCIPLNDAPLYMRYRIFRDGEVLFCKDDKLLDDMTEDTVTEALDFMPLREEAIRELV
ncbi:MAG: nucleotidyltransferase domain-containing protein [Deltaproteobacteria bacterium]|nr:nucleotidyltransferase domain-containing protein [Deltaproteobacteria bacterium]